MARRGVKLLPDLVYGEKRPRHVRPLRSRPATGFHLAARSEVKRNVNELPRVSEESLDASCRVVVDPPCIEPGHATKRHQGPHRTLPIPPPWQSRTNWPQHSTARWWKERGGFHSGVHRSFGRASRSPCCGVARSVMPLRCRPLLAFQSTGCQPWREGVSLDQPGLTSGQKPDNHPTATTQRRRGPVAAGLETAVPPARP